jgi:glycosyltransferase involved in cell wall biosynthesis
MNLPLVTIAVPSFNQGRFLDQALASIFAQDVPVEVFVVDGGSTDDSLAVIRRWQPRLAGWRSHADAGQAAAINEGIARGGAPYVAWLNSDDYLLPGALATLVEALACRPSVPVAYGRAWHANAAGEHKGAVWVRPFSERWLANACFICQPATLIRRSAWEAVDGVDARLSMAMDYDLWWRLYRRFGPLQMVDQAVAVNREHADTKTHTRRRDHYREAMAVVRRHYGRVPIKWWLAQPYAVWFRSLLARRT